MAYTGASDPSLPTHVQDLAAEKRHQWVTVYNIVETAYKSVDEGPRERRSTVAANTAVTTKSAFDGDLRGLGDVVTAMIEAEGFEAVEKAAQDLANHSLFKTWVGIVEDVQDVFGTVTRLSMAGSSEIVEAIASKSQESGTLAGQMSHGHTDLWKTIGMAVEHLSYLPHDQWDVLDVIVAEAINGVRDSFGMVTRKVNDLSEVGIPMSHLRMHAALGIEESHAAHVKGLLNATDGLGHAIHWVGENVPPVWYGGEPTAPAIQGVETTGERLTVKLFKSVDDDTEVRQRVALGVVLVPDEEDLQGDIISADEIERAAHNFVMKRGEIGVNHEEFPGDAAAVVESYLAPHDLTIGVETVSQGSWVVGVKIFDDDLLKRVESGELTGFSIGGSSFSREIG